MLRAIFKDLLLCFETLILSKIKEIRRDVCWVISNIICINNKNLEEVITSPLLELIIDVYTNDS